jgi:hypothetical protein
MLHELWVEDDGQTFCLAGRQGDQARALLRSTARLTSTVEAASHLDAMTKYYEYMGWGRYTSDYPELDNQAYEQWGLQ